MLVCVVLSCLLLAALWSPAGKELTPWLSCMPCFLVLCHFPKCVLVHININGEVGAMNCFSPTVTVPRRYIFCGSFVLCLSCFLRLFVAALWSPARKGLTSWLLFMVFNCVFVAFPYGILGQVWYLSVLIPDHPPFLL